MSAFDLKPIILAFCGTLLINFIINIFEETAWHGYLTSQLVKLNLHDWKIYLIVGCVWGLWHIPYYLVFLPESDIQAVLPVSRAVYAVVAFITLLCWAVMFIELFSDYIRIAAGKEIVVSPINGIITSILYLAVGLGIRTYRRQAIK